MFFYSVPLTSISQPGPVAMVSGPSATMYLADQGADVIKIEPLEGELMRKVGKYHNGMTNSFLCCNRSKRSLTLNLKDKKGMEIGAPIRSDYDEYTKAYIPNPMLEFSNGSLSFSSFGSRVVQEPVSQADRRSD